MKRIVTTFLIFIACSTQALELERVNVNTRLFCAVRYGLSYKKRVNDLKNDKAKHCTLSCMIAVSCPDSEAYIVGYLKEFWDLVGPGDADHLDIIANNDGIRLASSLVMSDVAECFEPCRELYPSK